MDVSSTHPDRKGNAVFEMKLAGYFSRFACQVRVNQLRFMHAEKGSGLMEHLLIAGRSGVKLEYGNVLEAKFGQIHIFPCFMPESVRTAKPQRQYRHAMAAPAHPLQFPQQIRLKKPGPMVYQIHKPHC
jgi:hypothetical protein